MTGIDESAFATDDENEDKKTIDTSAENDNAAEISEATTGLLDKEPLDASTIDKAITGGKNKSGCCGLSLLIVLQN